MRTKKCLTDGCENVGGTRGLCLACYRRLFMRVKRGKATWKQLVADGLAVRAQVYRHETKAQRRRIEMGSRELKVQWERFRKNAMIENRMREREGLPPKYPEFA